MTKPAGAPVTDVGTHRIRCIDGEDMTEAHETRRTPGTFPDAFASCGRISSQPAKFQRDKMSKKLVLLASVALVVLCGLMLVSGTADAVEPGAEAEPGAEGTTPTPEATGPVPVEGQVNQWTFGGCTYFVDAADPTLLEKPVAKLIGYDGATKNVVIPSVLKGLKVTVSGEEKVLDCSIVIGFAKDQFDHDIQVFARNTVLETLVFEDGAKDSIVIAGILGSGYNALGAFQNCTNLKSVDFGTSITKIPGSAFKGCRSLSTITFTSSLTTIESDGFNGIAITSLTIPDTITSLGNSAFSGCRSLAELNIGSGITKISDRAFSSCALTNLVIPDTITEIGINAFSWNPDLVTVDLGCNLTTVGSNAFQNTSIKVLNIPEKLELGEMDKFYQTWGDKIEKITVAPENKKYQVIDELLYNGDATELLLCLYTLGITEYIAPPSVNKIGDGVFNSVSVESALTTVNLTNVKVIGSTAFAYCESLETVEGMQNVTDFDMQCFKKCISLKSADLSAATTVPTYMFSECESLTTVVLPAGLTEIPTNAFYKCKALETINIPETVTILGPSVFNLCENLVITSLPDSITTIGDKAFMGCPNVNIAKLPESLTSIGTNAFSGTGIEKLTVGEFEPTIKVNAYAFWNCPALTSITFTKNCDFSNVVENDYGKIANGAVMKSIKFSANNWKVHYTGAITSKDGTEIFMYPQGKTGTFEVKSNVTKISDEAFKGCSLTEVKFNNNRNGQPVFVGKSCFASSPLLEKVVFCNDMQFNNGGNISDGVGNNIIAGCPSLQYVSFPNHGLAMRAIDGGGTFSDGSGQAYPSDAALIGNIYVGSGNGHLYKFCHTATSLNPETEEFNVYTDVNIIGDVAVSKTLNLTGSITLLPGASVNGTLYSKNNYIEFNMYEPEVREYIGVKTFAICISNDGSVFTIDGDAGIPFTGSMNEVSRVVGAEVTNFYNNGSGIIVDMASFTDAVPDGKLIVQYSVYTEYQGEQYVDPFKMKALDVAGDTLVKTDVGENMISCSVSYAYGYDGETYFTPASSSVNMLPMGIMKIEAPEDVTLTVSLDGKEIVSGDAVAFGPHAIDIQVTGDVPCTLNGKDVTTIESITYYGQKLVIVKATVEAP